jgi:hypothetical protein
LIDFGSFKIRRQGTTLIHANVTREKVERRLKIFITSLILQSVISTTLYKIKNACTENPFRQTVVNLPSKQHVQQVAGIALQGYQWYNEQLQTVQTINMARLVFLTVM